MEFIASSGAKVVINVAPWKDAKALKMAIEREVAHGGQYLLGKVILAVDSSEAVDAALWPCLARCLRNDEKITPSTFDSIEARDDYYDIVEACVQENLRPLVVGLSLKLKALGIVIPGQASEGPK